MILQSTQILDPCPILSEKKIIYTSAKLSSNCISDIFSLVSKLYTALNLLLLWFMPFLMILMTTDADNMMALVLLDL